jgi:hypothetical protein
VIATPDDPALIEELRTAAHAHGLTTRAMGEALVIVLSAQEGETGDGGMPALLRDAGFTPLWDTRLPGSRAPSRANDQEPRTNERESPTEEPPG